MDFEDSGSRTICAADFHDRQIAAVDGVDDVLARRKLGVPCMELKWNVDFKVSNDLRVYFARVNR
jgi:hypothetical protein